MKIGRPTKYEPEFCDIVVEKMSEGASIEELPLYLGVSKFTIYHWIKQNESFSDAIKEGVALSEAWWREKGRKNLENDKFSATLWYMNMKNRFGWADKKEIQATVSMRHEDALKELE